MKRTRFAVRGVLGALGDLGRERDECRLGWVGRSVGDTAGGVVEFEKEENWIAGRGLSRSGDLVTVLDSLRGSSKVRRKGSDSGASSCGRL